MGRVKNRLIKTREKYNWAGVSDIVFSKKADCSDRLFCLCMLFWYIPHRMVFRIVWLITYIPAMIFRYVDELLK